MEVSLFRNRDVRPLPVDRGQAPGITWHWRLSAATSEPGLDAGILSVACQRTPKMARLEAVLLVADAPLSPRRLAQLATLADATEARTLIARLNAASSTRQERRFEA